MSFRLLLVAPCLALLPLVSPAEDTNRCVSTAREMLSAYNGAPSDSWTFALTGTVTWCSESNLVLKDGTGNYLWQPAIKDGEHDTILGKRYFTSAFAPEIAAGAKTIAFGDFYYFWIGDRQGISIKRLNELYAGNGQVGFLVSKRLDGRLILPEAIKVLQQKAS